MASAVAHRPLSRPARDLRLDIIRGWLQVSIFGAHAVGSAFGAFGIHAAWGLSDSSEQFLFLSGFVLASVHTLKAGREGQLAAARDIWRRAARLWLVHLLLFLMTGALILWADMGIPLPGEVNRLGWRMLAEQPLIALPGAALLLYMPVYMDILPVFVLSMLALPGFLWLVGRIGVAALMAPALLWGGVQFGLWHWPGWLPTGLEPLAWQFVFMLGAWFGRRALLTGAAVRRHIWAVAAAAALLGAGVALSIAIRIDPALDFPLIWILAGKTHLGPVALLHALALAYLFAVLVPKDASWMHQPLAQAMAAAGRHSLEVFRTGLFLAWGVTVAFRVAPASWWLDPLLSVLGIGILLGQALLMDRRRMTPVLVPR
ncbi:OpgC domain-containing protein [Roseomonas sp. CAU 1739]|uniref:OpgC domain-containing protein n=1 Tax=Roseomonas sp. CAU 1739 TaxID=3140364 RepID=UPI00325AC57F